MSDYRFGGDYKLSIYPKEAIGYGGELDMDKVESVEIEWVDFVRKSEDKSRWSRLFGTPERAAETMARQCFGATSEECNMCVFGECDGKLRNSGTYQTVYDALLEWLKQ